MAGVDESPPTDRDGAGPGDRIGRGYVVEDVIGEGSACVVVRAKDTTRKRHVAIRIAQHADAETSIRFQRRARMMQKLTSVHSVRVHEVGETDDGLPWMVMDLLEGEHLGFTMKKRTLTVDEALTILIQICDVLGNAHDTGLVHRDLEPKDIFLIRKPGKPDIRLLDFELGEGIDRRTDVLAAGDLLSRLVAKAKDVPPAVDTIVRKCREKNPRSRFQSMNELAFALTQARDELKDTPVNTPMLAKTMRMEDAPPTPRIETADQTLQGLRLAPGYSSEQMRATVNPPSSDEPTKILPRPTESDSVPTDPLGSKAANPSYVPPVPQELIETLVGIEQHQSVRNLELAISESPIAVRQPPAGAAPSVSVMDTVKIPTQKKTSSGLILGLLAFAVGLIAVPTYLFVMRTQTQTQQPQPKPVSTPEPSPTPAASPSASVAVSASASADQPDPPPPPSASASASVSAPVPAPHRHHPQVPQPVPAPPASSAPPTPTKPANPYEPPPDPPEPPVLDKRK